MRHPIICLALLTVVWVPAAARAQTAAPVAYEVDFPEPEHHWMEVSVSFPGLGDGPLRARMSRSSPGRYAVHEFAKNVFHIEARDGAGRLLVIDRPHADEWRVAAHDGTVHLTYRIFGDQADGTYMAVDTTHAHLNMPAAFIWADGLDMRPITVTFHPPDGLDWTAATQLFPTADPFTFTAPNLQYFLDSPVELADLVEHTLAVPRGDGSTTAVRLAVHTASAQARVDALADLVARIVVEQTAIFGDLPVFDGGTYTFLIDTVPWADGDGMEHRNSTVIVVPGADLDSPRGREAVLDVISHEFFHVWNVERIRPEGLEPFDFTQQNVTCCLWLAEGFTQYYGPLVLRRAGLAGDPPMYPAVTVINSTARQIRSAVEMSEHAPFADAGVANDAVDRSRTFISYYTNGAAIALALDFSLRERSNGTITLDDYMRRLWQEFGRPVDPRPGYVTRPYSLADARHVLAAVSGDPAFADGFFDRYIEGHEAADYERLLALAGYGVESAPAGRGWTGAVQTSPINAGLLVGGRDGTALVPFGNPAYAAGLDAGDVLVSIDGEPATATVWSELAARPPGTIVPLVVERRDGRRVQTALTLGRDPTVRIVSFESLGRPLPTAARAFREAWLGSMTR